MKSAYIFDIDGTLASMNGRKPYDIELIHKDLPIAPVVNLYKHLRQTTPHTFFLITGRGEECRESTEAWLAKEGIEYDELHMRPLGDKQQDMVVKWGIYHEHLHGDYSIAGVFEDRLRCVRMWHELGLPVFRVGDPDADF